MDLRSPIGKGKVRFSDPISSCKEFYKDAICGCTELPASSVDVKPILKKRPSHARPLVHHPSSSPKKSSSFSEEDLRKLRARVSRLLATRQDSSELGACGGTDTECEAWETESGKEVMVPVSTKTRSRAVCIQYSPPSSPSSPETESEEGAVAPACIQHSPPTSPKMISGLVSVDIVSKSYYSSLSRDNNYECPEFIPFTNLSKPFALLSTASKDTASPISVNDSEDEGEGEGEGEITVPEIVSYVEKHGIDEEIEDLIAYYTERKNLLLGSGVSDFILGGCSVSEMKKKLSFTRRSEEHSVLLYEVGSRVKSAFGESACIKDLLDIILAACRYVMRLGFERTQHLLDQHSAAHKARGRDLKWSKSDISSLASSVDVVDFLCEQHSSINGIACLLGDLAQKIECSRSDLANAMSTNSDLVAFLVQKRKFINEASNACHAGSDKIVKLKRGIDGIPFSEDIFSRLSSGSGCDLYGYAASLDNYSKLIECTSEDLSSLSSKTEFLSFLSCKAEEIVKASGIFAKISAKVRSIAEKYRSERDLSVLLPEKEIVKILSSKVVTEEERELLDENSMRIITSCRDQFKDKLLELVSMLVVVTGSSKFTGTSYSFAEVVAGIEEELFQSIIEGLHVHVKVDFTRRRSTRMMGDLSKLSVKDIRLSLRYDA